MEKKGIRVSAEERTDPHDGFSFSIDIDNEKFSEIFEKLKLLENQFRQGKISKKEYDIQRDIILGNYE
jgi:hypothetical protein